MADSPEDRPPIAPFRRAEVPSTLALSEASATAAAARRNRGRGAGGPGLTAATLANLPHEAEGPATPATPVSAAARHRRVPSAGSEHSYCSTTDDVREEVRKSSAMIGRWKRGAMIGQGYQGRTYAAASEDPAETAVAKELRMHQIPSTVVRRIPKLTPVLKSMSHPMVAKYHEVLNRDKRLYVFIEMLQGGSLADLMHSSGPLPEAMVACAASQVLEALEFLHSQKLLHGALHAGNVMVDGNTGAVKLTDLNLLQLAASLPSSSGHRGSQRNTAINGLPNWLAPEIVSMQPGILASSDVWALGCTCVELLQGRPPWWDQHPIDVLHEIRHGQMPYPPGISDACRDFLNACLTKDYAQRPDATTLRRHPFILNAARDAKNPQRTVQAALAQHYKSAVAARERQPKQARPWVPPEAVQIDCADDDVEATLLLTADPLRELREALERMQPTSPAAKSPRAALGPPPAQQQAPSAVSPATLGQCIAAQERVISVAMRLQGKSKALKRELQRVRQRAVCTESALKSASDEVNHFSSRVRVMASNIARLQDHFLSSKEGGEKLATVLYGKLSSDALTGALAGVLEHLQGTPPNRRWRQGWFVLKDNFLFYFKASKSTGAATTTIQDIIYLPNMCAEPVPEDPYKKSNCFRVSGQVFAASSPETMRDWINAINTSLRWFEKEEEDDVIKAARRALAVAKHAGPKPKDVDKGAAPDATSSASGGAAAAAPVHVTRWAYAPVFGVPLRDLTAREPSVDMAAPAILDRLITHVIEHGCNEEGIFRVSGGVTDIEELKDEIEHVAAADVDLARHSVHTVAGVLKAFLRALPESLMPQDTAQLLADTLNGASRVLDADTVELFRWVLSSMDQHARAVVQRVSLLIVRITACSAVNKMNVDNLLTCLVPNLKVPPVIFLRAVENYTAVFPDANVPLPPTPCAAGAGPSTPLLSLQAPPRSLGHSHDNSSSNSSSAGSALCVPKSPRAGCSSSSPPVPALLASSQQPVRKMRGRTDTATDGGTGSAGSALSARVVIDVSDDPPDAPKQR
eukprot:m51a1_g7584 putative cell division control protein 15 cdc15 (1036) ;mRNA; f:194251-198288